MSGTEKTCREFLNASVRPSTVNKEERTIDVLWYSGADVSREDWLGGRYMLRFDPKGADLSVLNAGAAVLDTHRADSTASQVGKVEKAWAQDGRYYATLRFSRRPEVDGLWTDIQDGIVSKFSMGTEILASVERRDKDGQLQTRTATQWRPFELSVLALPADHMTQTLGAAGTNEGDFMTEQPNQTEQLLAAERERTGAILRTARVCGVPQDVAEKHIQDSTTIEAFRSFAIDYQAKAASPEVRTAHVVRDQREGLAEAMGEALAAKYTGREPSERARNYSGARLADLARECCRAAGLRVKTFSSDELIRLAMTTSDFPHLLQDGGRRMLLAAYETATPAIKQVAQRSTVQDFRAKALLRLGEAPALLQVPEGGEIQHGGRAELQESYRAYTYARLYSLSRQAMINDDLGAFADFQRAFGVAAAAVEAAQLTSIITSNPLMSDGVALFDAGHSNLINPGTAIDVTNLGIARKTLRLQTSLDGATIIDVTPKYLVTSAAKETLAEQYLGQLAATAATDVNPFGGRLTLVVNPLLDASSTTAWYLFADASLAPVIQYSYLDGREGPQIEMRDSWERLGADFRCYLDLGVGAVGHRGVVKNLGA